MNYAECLAGTEYVSTIAESDGNKVGMVIT